MASFNTDAHSLDCRLAPPKSLHAGEFAMFLGSAERLREKKVTDLADANLNRRELLVRIFLHGKRSEASVSNYEA